MYDEHLIDLMEKRMKASETIGHYKKENNITILQSTCWEEILDREIQNGTSKGLSREVPEAIFKANHQESFNHQMKVMNNEVASKAIL